MTSDDKNVSKASDQELPLEQLRNKRGTLPEKYDLDKNPVQYRQSDGSLSPEAHDKDYMELVLRSGKHSDLVQKILRQRIEQRAKEFPRWPGDISGGVRLMWIESRYWYDRERLSSHFNDDWRKYRSRYLHSLELDPSEPLMDAPEYHKSLINPIRRFYMKPGDWFEKNVIQRFTNDRHQSVHYRNCITKPIMACFVVAAIYYRLRYCNYSWEDHYGQKYFLARPTYYPGDKNWSEPDPRTHPNHHVDYGFLARNFCKDLRDYEDTTIVL